MKICEEAIKIQDVTFKYQKRIILDHVNLSIPKGKISLLMGASGSGKSTLSQIASGILPEEDEVLDSGEVIVFDKIIGNLKNNERAKYITMMFQNPDLQFCMETLRKEMRFCLENINIPKDEMDNRIEITAKELSLENLLDRKLTTLSGGEKQKATLCCLCVMNSKCLVLDEPFANLDRDSAISLIGLLKQLRDKKGITILAVDHQIDYWMDVFDNLTILGRNGKILAEGITQSSLSLNKTLFNEEGVFFPKLIENKLIIDNNHSFNVSESAIINGAHLTIKKAETSKRLKKKKLNFNIFNKDKSIYKKKSFNELLPYQQDNLNLINHEEDFAFNSGSITALLGKSGCGKTTFFLSLLKQHSYDGKLKYFQDDIDKLKLKDLTQNIGIVFQNPINQFVTQNVYDEVAFSIKLWNKGIGEKDLKNKTLSLLDDYGLKEYKRQSPYLLSQGQMRRLAVLSVLAGSQKVLLLDEPTYGQDSKSTQTIMKNLKSKIKNEGLTVIFTTHDRKVAATWADFIYEVMDGKFVKLIKSEGVLNE
jgi:energy-coupling factor transport system ATP-binding protein